MAQFFFGSGKMIGYRVDVANSTPQVFGTLQAGGVDFNANIKDLFGQNQFPVAVARGTVKIQGKASTGSINGRLLNDMFFDGSYDVGQRLLADEEAQSVPATAAYEITVTNAANFATDLGVINADETMTAVPVGAAYKRVASTPGVGEYSVSVSTGVYTFNIADASRPVKISYIYTASTTGRVVTISNKLLGSQPLFKVVLQGGYGGKTIMLELERCAASKLTLSTKQEDFMVPDFEFGAFADDNGIVGRMSFSEG